MRHRLLVRLIVCVLALTPAMAIVPAQAQSQMEIVPGKPAILRAGTGTAVSRVRRRATPSVSTQSATIQVTYHGFSQQAQVAFQYAVDIWKTQISSSVPIQIDATWEPLDPGVLGSAGPAGFVRNFLHAPLTNTWYPIGLANKLAGQDLAPVDPDIVASFSSSFSNWYFGTDGQTPFSQYDFVTTVLHELGHGLGFIGSLDVASGSGDWGYPSRPSSTPIIFDRFGVNGSGQQLINTSLFANPSAALAAQLQSNNIFFNGASAIAAGGGDPVRLYAPSIWEDGSSFSHLDEDAYPNGDPNSLMTPYLKNGESVHDTGPILLGVFKDIGWTVASVTPIAGLAASNNGPTVVGSPTTLSATITAGTEVSYSWSFGDGTSGSGATVNHTYANVGSYTATVTATNAQGSKTATTTVQILDQPIAGLAASNNGPTNLGNPTTVSATISAGTNVSYSWNFGDGTSGTGAAAAHLYSAAGTYTATVTATNPQGPKTASTTVTVGSASVSTTITPAGGTLTTPDSMVQISFPPNAVNTTVIVTYTALATPGHSLLSEQRLLRGFTLQASTNTGIPVTTFAAPYTLVVGYTDADIALRRLLENTVKPTFWDGSAWADLLPCSGCSVNTTTNRVTLALSRTGEFAVVGDSLRTTYLPLIIR